MDRIRRGEPSFVTIDVLHRERLDELLDSFKISGLSKADKLNLNNAWHRLDPWPDEDEWDIVVDSFTALADLL